MKPCSKNRKLITWLTLDELDAGKAAALREHLSVCEGCRGYFLQISKVTEKLAAAAPDSNLEATEAFHCNVARKLQAVESSSVLENLTGWLRESMLNWRIAVPTLALAVIAAFVLVVSRQDPVVSVPTRPVVQTVLPINSETELAPTIANYQLLASQSLEEFDEVLIRQGNKRLPQAPPFSVAELANASF